MRKVEASIIINTTPERVFNSWINAKELKSWWGVERSLVEKKQGGLYSLTWGISEKGFQYISTGLITVFKPGRHLLIDHFVYFNPDKQILGPTYLDIKLSDKPDGTEIKLTQGGYQAEGDWNWYHDAVQAAWPNALKMLKDYLEA